jgi:hypothetical protein
MPDKISWSVLGLRVIHAVCFIDDGRNGLMRRIFRQTDMLLKVI